jgi:hypothetical protein
VVTASPEQEPQDTPSSVLNGTQSVVPAPDARSCAQHVAVVAKSRA